MDDYSRQRRYQEQHKAKGLCAYCSGTLAPGSRSRCSACLLKGRKRMRRVLGVKPWSPKRKIGRPPLEIAAVLKGPFKEYK